MANWKHIGGDPFDYNNYEQEGEDEGCGSMIFVIVVLIVIAMISMCSK